MRSSRLATALIAVGLIAAPLAGCGGATRAPAATRTATAAAHPAARAAHPPVVFLMFDEFDTSELFDRAMHVDPVRYPNIARLVRSATFYRRFTAAGDVTGPASGSLLASTPYRLGHRGTYANFPDNLFTRFHRAGYGLTVRESATALCPTCPGNRPPQDARDVVSNLASGRVARFDAWLGQLHRTRHPTLFFAHVLLPHGPLLFTPSGHRYRVGRHEPIRALGHGPSFADPWFVRQGQQRYLMQVELADALVGRLVARLKATGLWNRAAVVVTADNGEGWGHLHSDPHRIDPRTVAQIVETPLIVKAPGQRRGGYSDRRVRAVDLLPTVARLAHVSTRGMAGWSFLGPQARHIPAGPIEALDDHGRIYRLSGRQMMARIRADVARRTAIFGQHTRELFRIGPRPDLLGRPLGAERVTTARGLRATLGPQPQLRHVKLRASILPTHLVGVLRGRGARRGLPIAVAVNGRIVATGWTGRLSTSPRTYVSMMIPESSLRDGRNDVQLLLIRPRSLARVRL